MVAGGRRGQDDVCMPTADVASSTRASVPLLKPDEVEVQVLAQEFHLLHHVMETADVDVLVLLVSDLILNNLLDVSHAALPLRCLRPRDRRIEVKVPVLPRPPLEEIA